MANLDIIRGRQVIETLTNRSGGAVNEGDVVIIDIANDESFTTTTVVGNILVTGVVQEDIANLAAGRVLVEGYAAIVEVDAATARGDFLKTGTVATQATPVATMDPGVFARARTATVGAGQVSAELFGVSGGATFQDTSRANEIMNFPSMERADGAQPEWWEEGADCTLTEEDVVGEGITETWERCLKVVTTGTPRYAYQRYTYADQPRIKSGRPLSVLVAVWSVGAVSTRVRLQSSVGSLGVSPTTTAAAWTLLRVDGVTLDGINVELRLEVDTGTAYFVPLGLCIGGKAFELPLRALLYQWCAPTEVKSLTGIGDEDTWTDIDVTGSSSNLACIAQVAVAMYDDTPADVFLIALRRNGSADGGYVFLQCRGSLPRNVSARAMTILDDAQIFEYKLDREAGAGTLGWGTIQLIGWWQWG